MILFIVTFAVPAFAQKDEKDASKPKGLHAKIEARKKESEKPKAITGAVELQVTKSFDQAFEKTVNWVNKNDFQIDPENTRKEIGQITTTIVQVDGGYSQAGTRLRVTVIKEDDNNTTLKVLVEKLSRKKLFGAEPWSNPKVDLEQTQKVVDQMKTLFAVEAVASGNVSN